MNETRKSFPFKIVAIVAAVGLLIAIFIALVVPNNLDPNLRAARPKDWCINNLRIIDAAKNQWAFDHKKSGAEIPTWDDLKPYIIEIPKCPAGGIYTIGSVSNNPTCSISDHVLP